jgi:hypothetical protein
MSHNFTYCRERPEASGACSGIGRAVWHIRRAALALKVYAQAMRRTKDEKMTLGALVGGPDWANIGERGEIGAPAAIEREAA